jgi:predicted RNA-binding Zn-ribbon protein involved in translation (DUF1610 family)
MLDLLSTQNTLHTRLIDFSLQEYLFVVQVVLGERIEVAYANTFDTAEFKRNVPSEDEEEYLLGKRRDAEIMLEQQNCRQLREYLESEYQMDIQERASTLKDYKFTGAEIQKLLNNLLHERSSELSEASVRDILALIKSMYDSGALDSGDNFQNHFITIPSKYNALCINCSHEFYAVEGLSMKCPNCGAVYNWDEQQNRFIPEIQHL